MACKIENTPTRNTYYVAPYGDDTYSGTESQPWGSIQYAVDNVGPGSTIFVMDGEYKESILFKNAGSEGEGYITLQKYPGHQPVISGGDRKETFLIYINNKHHIKIIGFDLGPLQATRGFPSAIWVVGAAHHIEIRDNYIHHIENDDDAHSQFSDPHFVDQSIPDFHLLEGSPAIGMGILLPEVGDTDINGNPRIENGTINQGATASVPR